MSDNLQTFPSSFFSSKKDLTWDDFLTWVKMWAMFSTLSQFFSGLQKSHRTFISGSAKWGNDSVPFRRDSKSRAKTKILWEQGCACV